MEISANKKDIIGIIFFVLSIFMLIYLFISPLNQIIVHFDEYFTLTTISLPIRDLLTVTSWDVHPPLYYLMAKVVAKLSAMFGIDLLFSLKILSIIPYGLILVISATKIRKNYGWITAGLFAFSLVVMSEFFKHYLAARMYSWAILFVLLAFIYYREVITEANKKSWILLTIFSVLAAYTHYFAAISLGCLYLILLFYIIKYKKEEVKNWGLSVVGAVILYVPWIFPLMNQLGKVHQDYWIPELDLNTVISSFGYFAHNSNILFSIIAIFILAVVIASYTKQSQSIDDEDYFYILSGIGVYLGTIILGIIISVIFKPILVVRYLLPAAAVLWLTISIVLSKMEDKKMFLISLALIILLLISGIATLVTTNDSIYKKGIEQKEILDNITQDNNSIVIVKSQHMIMYFLYYSCETDMYCLHVDHLFGENMDRLQKIFDFKDYNKTEIDELIANNSDKNIYIISWGSPHVNSTTIRLSKWSELIFSKVNTTSPYDKSIN